MSLAWHLLFNHKLGQRLLVWLRPLELVCPTSLLTNAINTTITAGERQPINRVKADHEQNVSTAGCFNFDSAGQRRRGRVIQTGPAGYGSFTNLQIGHVCDFWVLEQLAALVHVKVFRHGVLQHRTRPR